MKEKLLAVVLLLSTPACAGEALREAALAALCLRSSGPDAASAALESAYDGSPEGLCAAAPLAQRTDRRYRLLRAGEALRDAPAALPIARLALAPEPGGAVLEQAFRLALGPWKALLDLAWGGAWTGLTPLKAWLPTSSGAGGAGRS